MIRGIDWNWEKLIRYWEFFSKQDCAKCWWNIIIWKMWTKHFWNNRSISKKYIVIDKKTKINKKWVRVKWKLFNLKFCNKIRIINYIFFICQILSKIL